MSLSISPQIRIVALLGIVLAVVAGGAFTVLGRSSATSAPVKTIIPLSQRHGAKHLQPVPARSVKATTAPRARAKTATPSRVHAKAKTASRAHAKTVATTPKRAEAARPKAKTPKPLSNPYHLPLPLVTALAAHDVVVVALYSPESKVDTIAYAEARAGAVEARGNVGFVALSVLDARQVRNLTEQLGLLSDPGVLVYRKPGTLAVRIDGFADRDTVAQAADNALLG